MSIKKILTVGLERASPETIHAAQVFVDWLRVCAGQISFGATPEELWEFRNSLLHMSNPESRKVAAGKGTKLTLYVGAKDHFPSTDPTVKYISVDYLI